MAGAQLTTETELHPDALLPPFQWDIALPTDWALVPTHPAHWQRQVDRVVDDYFAGKRLPTRVRRQVTDTLGAYVATAQKQKILLSLVKVGVDAQTSEVRNTSMQLMWTTSAPAPASMSPVRRSMEAIRGRAEELTTPAGTAFGLVSVTRRNPMDPSSPDLQVVQAFHPVPGTTWTLVLSITTPAVGTADDARALAVRCIGSLAWNRSTPDASVTPGGADSEPSSTRHVFSAG